MSLEEKLAQLVGYWLDQGGNVVAPMQGEMGGNVRSGELADVTRNGIGHYTRVYGTRPVDGAERAAWLWQEQRRLQRETRLGIPALVHEECLTGLAAWKATTYPTPLAWGASFDPALVAEVGSAIGRSMHALGIHQGLAPVMDVIRDPRWGRVDECIGEDPYLVGTIGTAFVQGLQSEGVHATLKHFLGYSGSAAGRNHAPTDIGPREVADVFLPPFEMAILDGNARSVMNSYVDIDGIPMAASEDYLTGVLREQLGFTGVVVADYFAIAFLEVMQAVAADRGEAARLALVAGIDVELPAGDAYLEQPLAEQVRSGAVDEGYVDRAVLRALAQKESLGLLDPAAYADEPPAVVDLDSPQDQALARKLAEESVVLLANDGGSPAVARRRGARPDCGDRPQCQPPRGPSGLLLLRQPRAGGVPRVPGRDCGCPRSTRRWQLRPPHRVPRPTCCWRTAVPWRATTAPGFAEAVAAATASDVAVVVVGDQAGLFGRGTVGEGNDTDTLALPGVQRQLVEAVVATGTPVVLVLLTGRPYAIGWALDGTHARPAAVLQAFFPGEGGGLAIADIITGAVNPSGRAPGHTPPVRRGAALLLPPAHPRRTIRGHVDRPDPAAPVRLRVVVHHLHPHRPGGGRQRVCGLHLHGCGHRDQQRPGRRRHVVDRCTAGDVTVRSCARWPSCSGMRGSVRRR